MSFRKDALEERRKDVLPRLREARELAEKAESEGRSLTDAEQKLYDDAVRDAKSLSDAFEKQRHDDAVFAFAKDLASSVGDPAAGAARTKGQRLSFKGMGASAASKMRGVDGQKALSPSGAAVVAQEFTSDPVALGKPALSLLDVLPVIAHATPEISYLRQTARTNAAATVAAGAVKPTSVYSVTRIENSLAVVAHLSEGIARHWLLDNNSLETFIANELEYGLQLAVEAKVMTDVNATSGIQTLAYNTSVLATLRRGVTKLEIAGYTPSAFVLTPTDWEGVELALSSTNSIEHQGLPYDPATRRLFGVPVTTSNAQAAGVGHILATGAVALDTDTRGVDIQWSENATADSFSKNLVFARCESRYATSVFAPLGVCTLDLTP